MAPVEEKAEEKTIFAQNQTEPNEHSSHENIDFSILPCEGIFKLTGKNEPVGFSYCKSAYWQCPNTKCIMQLV